jgi:hypothetical protein
MLRVLGIALAGALVLSAGSTEHKRKRLTKENYIAAVGHATGDIGDRLFHEVVDFEMPGAWPPSGDDWLRSERRLRVEIEHLADRLERLDPPAEVAETHASWISSLRNCAVRLRKLEGSSPLDGVIVAREMKPCFDGHREICDRFYAKDYSFS